MDTNPTLSVGHELRARTETEAIPVTSTTPGTSEQPTTWRSSLGVIIALVLALVAITLVSA